MKKNIFTLLLMFIITFFPVKTWYADSLEPVSKQVSFSLEQDYEACSFTITTEYAGNFLVTLTGPNNFENSGIIENSDSCSIMAETVRTGKYTVTVTENQILQAEDNSENEDTEEAAEDVEETEQRSADEVIGKIKVSAKAIDKTAFSIGNVAVARDILGLKYYFKDEAIVVEWTDLSCGNVNVTIIDAKSSQILDKQVVKDNYYEYELNSTVDEIIIDVVPATSSNITGANSQYTVKVENNPDATVAYENKEYVNTDTVPVTVTLNDNYSLLFLSNGVETQKTGLLSAGEYTYEVPVQEGTNEITTYVIDKDHNMRSTSYSVIRDSVKPALTLAMEYDGAKTYNTVVTIEGTIKDYETFKINEVEPVVTGDGSFAAEYMLNDGENILNIRATDIAGNETLYVAHITKVIKEKKIPWVPIGSGALCVIAGIIYFVRKRNGNTEKPMKEKKVKEKRVKEKNNKIQLNTWQKAVVECGVFAVISWLFFTNVLMFGNIPSCSMEPTLTTGDYAIVNGLAYVRHEPQRGDIVIFTTPESGDKTLIKRIIGVPGDSLVFVDGYIYLNGELIHEEYLPEDVETNCALDFEEVPTGCYFVMGDNRENSYDSRFWNDPYVRMENIEGKLMTVIPVTKIRNTIVNLFR